MVNLRIYQSDSYSQDKESVGNLVKLIDKSNGYIFAGMEASAVEFSKIAVGATDWDYYRYPYFVYNFFIIYFLIAVSNLDMQLVVLSAVHLSC